MAAILSLTALLDSVATPAAAGWLLKITLLTGIACASVALLRRGQPALRHAIAAGSLLAVALLPAVSGLLPAVDLPVLPSRPVDAPATPVAAEPAPVIIEHTPPNPYVGGAIDAPVTVTAGAVEVETPSVMSRVSRFARGAVQSPANWFRLAAVLWILAAGALFIRLAIAFRRANEIARGSVRINDDAIEIAVDRACRVLRVRRRPSVAISSSISIPMVVGVLRPRITLPATASSWSHQRLGVVLLHEIAHIKRRDPVWMLIAQSVSSILWFHPLVRMLALHVRRDSELACDELVLRAGVRPSDYAGHLVSIASMSARRDPVFAATFAFAARSTLEQRVTAILSARRRAATRRVVGAVTVMSLALFITIAVARPVDRAREEYEEGKQEYQAAKADFELQRSIQQAMQAAQQSEVVVPQCAEAVEAAQDAQSHLQFAYSDDGQTKIQFAYAGGGDDDEDEEEGEEWYDRAQKHYQRERWEQAGRAYENAARFGYNRATAYYNAGCSYALANMTDPAMDALEAAFDEGFDDLDMYASDSDLNSVRDTPRFKKLMETVRDSDDGDQRRRQATRQFDRLAGGKNIDEGEWSSVGIDLMRAGDYDRAATAFDNEFKLSKNTSENALYNQACARALGGKTDEALKLLDQSITVGSVDAGHMQKDPDLLSLHKSKRFDELVKLAEDLELEYDGLNTGDVWSFNGKKPRRISYADEVKAWKKSVTHFTEMANRHPRYGRAWFNLGYAQLKAEEPKNATPSFQKSLDLGYKPATMMYNLACSTALSGEIDAAFAWLDKSEKAGFEVWNYARWDEDLDPLRADPRYKEIKKRWKEKEREHDDKHDHDDDDDHTILIDVD